MTQVEAFQVDLVDRGYQILVGPNLICNAAQYLSPLISNKSVIIITDRNVSRHHLEKLTNSMKVGDITYSIITLPAGEDQKSFEGLQNLVGAILNKKPERGSTLIAFGGGVVGDLTGFAASIILRGIDFIQIPTTLLAQVDSSVGGKTGINTPHGKNLVGSFYQPLLVLSDTKALETLPRRELLAGYAEIVKYGLIGDKDFYEWLEQNGNALVDGSEKLRKHAIIRSCRAKAKIVSKDEKELGNRALLNFGHTFGHALEAETGFGGKLLHGEAVSIGMVMAFDLSVQIGICSPKDAARVRAHLASMGLPIRPRDVPEQKWCSDTLLRHMAQDKKVHKGKMTFILTRGIGQTFITSEVDNTEVKALLSHAVAA